MPKAFCGQWLGTESNRRHADFQEAATTPANARDPTESHSYAYRTCRDLAATDPNTREIAREVTRVQSRLIRACSEALRGGPANRRSSVGQPGRYAGWVRAGPIGSASAATRMIRTQALRQRLAAG